jgi:endonuclease YncB( thermonuclease family)
LDAFKKSIFKLFRKIKIAFIGTKAQSEDGSQYAGAERMAQRAKRGLSIHYSGVEFAPQERCACGANYEN